MSGIFGLFNLEGAPVEPAELRNMASLLTHRGPDRTGIWNSGAVGLGHTLLATTPEAVDERLPLEHSASGCVITADVRLDNRAELLAKLDLGDRAGVTGDAEILLAGYLAWGEACVERLLGDFAFAIWDPRQQTLFCARDQVGMRSVYYHHHAGRFLAFATEPRAILVLPQTPYRINEARIADFLVGDLEGVDKSSTFFEEVFRLPPAHTMTVTSDGMRQRRYWTPEPGPELRLPSDEAYNEAFLAVFGEAVRCRLRSNGPSGSMLSGGMDSGTVVAVASQLLAAENRGPLLTFSAVSPDGDADIETRTIRAALTMDGLDPSTVSYGTPSDLLPDLAQLMWEVEEPFDGHMTLPRAVCLAAHSRGLTTLLDGGAGDAVFSEGRRLARLLRAGQWRTAYRDAVGQNRFWKGDSPPVPALFQSARAAFVPETVLRRLRPVRQRQRVRSAIRNSLISEEFARQVDVPGRFQTMASHRAPVPLSDSGLERAQEIDQPHLTTARERYNRVAAAVGVESRDPFLDLRVTAFCARLPDRQVSEGGWPKAILRRATAERLPAAVRWRRGKEHLGWAFTVALMEATRDDARHRVDENLERIRAYVEPSTARRMCLAYLERGDASWNEEVYDMLSLGEWLRRNTERPKPSTSKGTDDDATGRDKRRRS